MVKLQVKKGDDNLFLYETGLDTTIDDVLKDLVAIHNGRLKVQRICAEVEELAQHGITLPPNMMGLTDEQVQELKLRDEWEDRCEPSGGHVFKKDDIGRRNGRAPNEKMAEVLKKTSSEAKDLVSKKKVDTGVFVTLTTVTEALNLLKGAVMIVYPMGLPPHDPIRMELENNEDLSGMQASMEVIDYEEAALWWAGKEMLRGKKLTDYLGRNDKTKIVTKLQKKGQGPPGREPVVNESEQKQLMAHYYRKQEAFKKLEKDEDDSYMDAAWADSSNLKRQFQGMKDIKWGPR